MADEGRVNADYTGRIAIIEIDNPPVNAASAAVRSGLLDTISEVARRTDIDGAVLIGAGKTFVSGSDIREFDGPIAEPQMPAVVAAIEACAKPVVAAIHGNALGGGFEIALACDGRIATEEAQVGLPEVTLGIIPGAGGTQRLPRLVGKARAIALITSGRRVAAAEAASIGMIDRIARGNLRQDAVAFALELAGRKRRLAEMNTPPDDPEMFVAAVAAARRLGRRNSAVAAAIDAVGMAGAVPVEEALRRERAAFNQLRQGEESAARRHLFFAERSVLRGLGKSETGIDRVGIVGLGLMGSGIAAALASAGVNVLVTDLNEAAVRKGEERIRNAVGQLVARGVSQEADAAPVLGRVTAVKDVAALADAALAIEAVFEDLAVKRQVFRALGEAMPPPAILASNTSYLDIDSLAAVTKGPERVAGLHFFSPAHRMRPVEIVRGAATSAATADSLSRLVARIGKLPIPARNAEGFIGNRILAAYRQHCEYLLEEGVYPEDVDRALTDFGMAMGPFAVSDMAGLDIAWSMRKRRAKARDPRERYAEIADRLCEAGRFGRKTGAGWYRYRDGSSQGEPDDDVHRIVEEASRANGIARRAIGDDEICDRALAAIVNEAAKVVAEGIAERPGDVDLLFVHGYGFPDSRGGPLFWAGRQPRAHLLASIDRMVAAGGFGASRSTNLDELLSRPAPAGRTA